MNPPPTSLTQAAGQAAVMGHKDVALCLYTEGETRGYQLCIEDATGGVRLAGPKFIGNSELLQRRILTERDAESIRLYLEKAYPIGFKKLHDSHAALVEALERIASYDAPDAHAMIQIASAALAAAKS